MNAPSATLTAVPTPVPFRRIVCGVDGSPSAVEGVRQASALAGPATTIELVAVTHEWGYGPTAGALLSEAHAEDALRRAGAELSAHPARLVTRVVRGRPAWQTLLAEACDCDLLVVARHGWSRIGGILIGSTASNVTHRAQVPILIALKQPGGRPFPGHILIAADGPGHPETAVRIGARIAALNGSDVTLVRLDWARRAKRPELAAAIAELEEITGREPLELLVDGSPHHVIPRIAEMVGASLLITGSRGLHGAAAGRSVSERVAHNAPCSVLIVRPQC